jgi:squalene synthase HpnC
MFNKEDVYYQAVQFAKKHYENFPVVSLLVPKTLRNHIAIIYWFARTADDIADEGNLTDHERIKQLNLFEENFLNLKNGICKTPFDYALYLTIEEKKLTTDLFLNLIKAFKQDVIKKRYTTYDDLLEYCKNSANPVGRLILELCGIRNDEALFFSDKICTALQLTNFYQDLQIDYSKGRIYLPQDEMEKFGVSEKLFELKENNLNFKRLLKYNLERTASLFNEGKKLFGFLGGFLKYEIKWTVLGGETILGKIKNIEYDVLNNRPTLSKTDMMMLFVKTFLK